MIDYAFSELGVDTIQASPIEDNTASMRVLEKLGFTVHETGVTEESAHGGDCVVRRYRIHNPLHAEGVHFR